LTWFTAILDCDAAVFVDPDSESKQEGAVKTRVLLFAVITLVVTTVAPALAADMPTKTYSHNLQGPGLSK